MLKIRAIVPVAALALLAACGGDDVEDVDTIETDAATEPAPGAVVTPPVEPVPATGDTMMMPDTMAGATGAGTTGAGTTGAVGTDTAAPM